MHITHSGEDEYLQDLLDQAQKAVGEITGDTVEGETLPPEFQELIFERARYAYNDQLEFFNENFRDALLSRALQNYKPGGDTDE
ncbi:hypothetical protein IV56_GL000326 [Lacticaseibacillus saniviri JCM 17471 = DSM 24301]|uniref:Phage gp6-like head-tail connector protein n=2 Tax=Lacticaseibacillus saniviri TaxID=931533 RepID=A0A0R2MY93_9LACO|nr:hypothetical protein IV56_GL000326 [Lacticaseibacillus saniviri JCM 17471 = DSM 24301]